MLGCGAAFWPPLAFLDVGEVAVEAPVCFADLGDDASRVYIPNTLRDDELRFELEQRTASVAQELTPLAPGQATFTFSDVRWNGHRALSKLRCQPEDFMSGKVARDSVCLLAQLHRRLPGEQIFVVHG